MKSRSLLLAAMLFAVPVFADNTNASDAQVKTEKTASEAKPEGKKEENKAPETKSEAKPEDKKEESKAPEGTPTTEEAKTFFQKVAAVPAFLVVGAPDWAAKNTLGKLAAIECLKDTKVASFLANEWTGRVAVYGAAAIVAYVIYKKAFASDADDIDTDEEEIFNN